MNENQQNSSFNRRDFLKLTALLPLLKVELPDLSLVPKHAASNQPNILLLVFDTLSASHLPVHGYSRDTAPNITRFAERATVYHNHYASGNFTTPGTASMFTGVYPWTHRAFNLHGTVSDLYARRNFFSLMPAGITKTVYSHNLLVTSLFRQFQQDLQLFKNTRDLCLVDGQYSDRFFSADANVAFWSEGLTLRGSDAKASSLFLSMFYRMIRLANKNDITQEYGKLFPRGLPNLNDIYFVLEDAVDWVMQEVSLMPQPYLAYFHFLPPHEPYTTRRDFVDRFADGFEPISKPESSFSEGYTDQFLKRQRREYDEYLAYADAEFGRLLDHLEATGTLDNTYVILTSDHGELFERGIRGHVTQTLYDPVIQVPLMISEPGNNLRKDIHTPTSCVDLMPTLLHLVGQPAPDWCDGKLLPGFSTYKENPERSIYALEAKSSAKYGMLKQGTLMLRKGDYKLIHYKGYGRADREWELFDLKKDPDELEDLYTHQNPTARELQAEVEEKLRQVNAPYEQG